MPAGLYSHLPQCTDPDGAREAAVLTALKVLLVAAGAHGSGGIAAWNGEC
jgi:hypothetical protein